MSLAGLCSWRQGKTEGVYTGVGRVGGAGERESAVEDEEGDGGEEVEKVRCRSRTVGRWDGWDEGW